MVQVDVRLFGCFRGRSDQDPMLRLEIPGPATVGELRKLLAERLPGGPVAQSVLADESQVLEDGFRIDRDCRLALLPPVSGG